MKYNFASPQMQNIIFLAHIYLLKILGTSCVLEIEGGNVLLSKNVISMTYFERSAYTLYALE